MKITALAGGIGAAKLLTGLAALIPHEDLSVIVNTGDDFRWMGLYVCPDLDTILYSLAGISNPVTGWGVRDESFHCLERLGALGCDTWFRIGDRDLATHIFRTQRMAENDSLSRVTASLQSRYALGMRILPMTDSHVPTRIHTDEGPLPFQDYFVRRHCEPRVLRISFDGIESSRPAPGVVESILEADAVILCPSNPFISIGPILAVPGIRAVLAETRATVLAVSPIVAGEAIKGPAADMMRQLGYEVAASSVAALYQDFLDLFVCDCRDRSLLDSIAALGMQVRLADTIMHDMETRTALARSILEMLP
jgi:LPPG:FO 2-phospho-L-lactate transferase